MKTILLLSPYWRDEHRWMVSSVKLAELWQRLGYTVIVLCMGHGASGMTMERMRAGLLWRRRVHKEQVSPTLTIYRVPDVFLRDPWNYGIAWGFSGVARTLVRQYCPDVIVVNKVLFWSSIALLHLRMAGKRVLLLTDALVGMTWWPRGRLARVGASLYAWTLGWLILRAATKVVFFHPQPQHLLRRLGIANRSQVIPTGIDPSPYAALPPPRSPSPRVTYIGRLESVKGADDFVAAALRARQACPSLRIRVVGWHAPEHPLVMAHRDVVEFTGLRRDIVTILSETDIFVLPSYAEGLSNALMEAMAAGRACIASDVGGNRFLIENGLSGFLFPAGDIEALAAHIRRLVEDPQKRVMLGERARQRILTHCSWETVGAMYRQIFDAWTA